VLRPGASSQAALFALGEASPAGAQADHAAVPAALAVGPAPPGWPEAPGPDAYAGLVGDIVAALAPHTEADPVAILAQALVAAGAVIGRGAHFAVEATLHHPNEYVLLVGESAKARKGSSWDHVARLMGTADPGFAARTSTGLSSGEGLVWALRDPALWISASWAWRRRMKPTVWSVCHVQAGSSGAARSASLARSCPRTTAPWPGATTSR